jgi:hypothetical protein
MFFFYVLRFLKKGTLFKGGHYSRWDIIQGGTLIKEIWYVGNLKYTLAESFYYVKYGSSIIMSKIPSKILSNENKKTGVSRKIVCFRILIHILS